VSNQKSQQEKTMKKKCVLAYSGGLDTSVILGWLIEQGYEVIAVYVDLGQPCEDREATLAKARTCGASKAMIVDVREELCRDFAFPVMQWQARYEGTYLLGTSIARPLISKVCVEIAHAEGATVYAHGATGKGTTSAGSNSPPRHSTRRSRCSPRGGLRSSGPAFPAARS
jgi:argininosuccinate synthase